MKAIRLTRAGILFALISLALLTGCEPGMHPPSAQAGVRGEPDPITTGKRLLAWNQPEMALKAFNRGIATGGGPTAMTGSAIALLKMGRVGEARTLLNRALSIAPICQRAEMRLASPSTKAECIRPRSMNFVAPMS